MNRQWVGFVAVVYCYLVEVIAFFVEVATSDKFFNGMAIRMGVSMAKGILVGLPLLPLLETGIGLLVIRKWRALQGWLMGFAFTALFSIVLLSVVSWIFPAPEGM